MIETLAANKSPAFSMNRPVKRVGRPSRLTKYKCSVCSQTRKSRVELERHEATHFKSLTERQTFECSECPLTFTTRGTMLRHQRAKHGTNDQVRKPYTCHSCPMTFSSRYNRDRHVAALHEDGSSSKYIQCPRCPRKFTMQARFEEHHTSEHEEATSIEPESESEVSTTSFMDSKVSSPAPNYNNNKAKTVLDEALTNGSSHRTAENDHRPNPNAYRQQLSPSRSALTQKNGQTPALPIAEPAFTPMPPRVQFFPSNGQQFQVPNVLMVNTSDRGYVCPEFCQDACNVHHRGSETPALCSSPNSISSHDSPQSPTSPTTWQQRSDPSMTAAACPQCSTWFASRCLMERHLSSVHGIAEYKPRFAHVSCPECQLEFETLQSLEAHYNGLHRGLDVLSQAAVSMLSPPASRSGSTVAAKSSLEFLMNAPGPAPKERAVFDCPNCTNKYLTRFGLHRHIFSAHPDQKMNFTVAEQAS